MRRWDAGLAVLAFAALAAGGAEAQAPSRDKLLLGAWTCSVVGNAALASAKVQFEPGGVMLLTFYNSDPDVKMAFVTSGLWSYDRASDRFSHTIRGARLTDIVVRGAPLPRAQFPGGEAAIAKLEDDFMADYADAKLTFSKVAEAELVLVDSDGVTLNCAH